MVSIQFTLTDFEQPSCSKPPDPWSIALTLAVDPDVTLQRHRRWSRDLHRDTPPSTPVLISRDSLFQTNSTLNLPLAPFWHKQDGGRFASTHSARQSKTRGPDSSRHQPVRDRFRSILSRHGAIRSPVRLSKQATVLSHLPRSDETRTRPQVQMRRSSS